MLVEVTFMYEHKANAPDLVAVFCHCCPLKLLLLNNPSCRQGLKIALLFVACLSLCFNSTTAAAKMASLRCSPTSTIQRSGLPSAQRGVRLGRFLVRAVETAPAETKTASPSSSALDNVQFINPVWSQPSSEKEFLGLIAKLVEAKKCPPELQAGWIDFYQNYRKTVESSGVADAEKVATKVQATIADTVFNQVRCPGSRSVIICV